MGHAWHGHQLDMRGHILTRLKVSNRFVLILDMGWTQPDIARTRQSRKSKLKGKEKGYKTVGGERERE